MPRQLPLFLQVMLLASLAVRLAVGAPCCWSGQVEPQGDHAAMAHHGAQDMHAAANMDQPASDHEGHGDGDNRAGPCCSACGPVLASTEVLVLAKTRSPETPLAFAMRDLPRRDILRLYEATGPPLRV